MSADLLLAIDQGTTSTRAIAFDRSLRPVAAAVVPLTVRHPRPTWVEQDADELLESVISAVEQVIATCGSERIGGIGLDNPGETVVAWDAETGHALAPAIVWQCRRSIEIVERLRADGREPEIRGATGLPLDPYFSAGKMAWLIQNRDEVQLAAQRGTLRLGTVDAWLTWHLGGEALTDPSTASRTQLFGIRSLRWEERLLAVFGVPSFALPRVVPSVQPGMALHHPRWGSGEIPLTAMICDQQAALAGNGCIGPGAIKATFGTGVFVLAVTGTDPPDPGAALAATVAWQLADGATTYALEGGVFSAGALLGWLRDGLGLIADPLEAEALAMSVPDSAGVRLLPALAGIGAPWWRPRARAVISGLTAATTRAHVARAALDGIAHRTADVLDSLIAVMGDAPDVLRVDGGLTANGYLLQRQADLLGIPLAVAANEEATAMGAACLAGLGVGWLDTADIAAANPAARTLRPGLAESERRRERAEWRRFLEAAADLSASDQPAGAAQALAGKGGQAIG